MSNRKKGIVSKAVKAYVKKEMKESSPMKQSMLIYAGSAVGTTGLTRLDFNVPIAAGALDRGDSYNQRQGDVIKVHEVEFRGAFNCAAVGAYRVRAILIYEKITANVDFTTTDLLYTNTTNYALHSPYNHDQIGRFRILSDTTHEVTSKYVQVGAGGTNVSLHIHKKFKIPLKSVYAFGVTLGSIADVEQGRIVLLLISDNTNATILPSTLTIVYTDE